MVYPGSGREFTQKTMEVALQRAEKEGCCIVVASTGGYSAKELLRLGAAPERVVCVTHMVGFREPGMDEMPPKTRQELLAAGAKVLTTGHALAGVDRAVRRQFQGLYPAELTAHTLRLLGQGVKVAVEIAVMALDAGLIPYGRKVVSVAGSSQGADTALVITPAHSHDFFDTKIHEILCKPREW